MHNLGTDLWALIEKIVYHVLCWGLGLFHRKLSDEMLSGFIQFVKFGIVGVSNTVISYVLYVVSLLILQRLVVLVDRDYLIAQILSFVLSVLWSFYWNNRIVFRVEQGESRSLLAALAKTYISYSFTGLFLNGFLLIIWVQELGISEFIAPLINIVFTVPLNFLLNKFWAFKNR
jgi:putative flippase GtrA